MASRVTLAVSADARDVVCLSIYLAGPLPGRGKCDMSLSVDFITLTTCDIHLTMELSVSGT